MSNYRLIFLTCLLSIGVVFFGKLAFAQNSGDNFLLKPVDKGDRLIPPGYGTRELTSFEKYRLEETISELDRAAEAQLEQGNADAAMKLWYRRLMLTRALDPILEIEALGKVGAIAWKENRGTDVRNIAERLSAIEEELTGKISFAELNKLATAYEQVRYLDKATGIYQQVVVNERKNSPITQEKLKTLGELYLARFKYSQAADIYQELLSLTEVNEPKQVVYLQNLADIYDRISQPEQAIAVKQRLIALSADTQTSKIADLQIAIARDYETLNQTDEAIEAYNRALEIAFTDRELATASDILSRIGEIYQDKEIDKAIATYNRLLEVQQQSYNDYGMLDTYDTLGKIYLDLDKTKSRQYFQQGLELATSLNYKVEYFSDAIERINNK